MSLRRKRWEERDEHRKLLNSVPMPTPETERRIEEARRVVEKVFGSKPPLKKRKGKRRGKK